jgi:N-acetylglucosamine-6-phosphate deacetylase
MDVPGLIDLQVNGYKGVDFSSPDLTEGDFARTCRQMLDEGATAFLPTVITSSEDTYRHNLPVMAKVMRDKEFRGRLPGIHLEGPFISGQDGARGAHNIEWVRRPDVEFLKRLIEWAEGGVKLLTIAAELEGAAELCRYATGQGITVSLGHQAAGEDDLRRLADAGAKALTHLGNSVPLMMPRHENPIFAGLGVDELAAMIITDGHHLPASVIKTILRTKGPDKCIVTSDATALSGMPAGEYNSLGNTVILTPHGRIYNPETGYLVGSSATMLTCMNHLAALKLFNTEEFFKVCFNNPLALIGVAPGDLSPCGRVCFDEQSLRFKRRGPNG